ncbi:response regulator [Gemmatimonas sp.]|uniref:response regulator n=1 Tax=Gemmatimonas sp. TaxID=1962908 RepID=UPI00286E92BC|nr:response regulator [Gemmatimonas sp.]
MVTPSQRDDAALVRAVDAIWARSRSVMLAHVDCIEAAAASLLTAVLSMPERAEAQRAAHRLAGTVGTFGFHAASAIARELEVAFEACTPGDSVTVLRIAEQSLALRAALDAHVARTGAGHEDAALSSERERLSRHRGLVAWMVGADEERLGAIAVAAVASGATVIRQSAARLASDDGVDVPDLLFLTPSSEDAAADVGDGYAATVAHAAAWRSQYPQVLTVVLESRELESRGLCEVATRLAIVAADAFGPVPRCVNADDLLAFVQQRWQDRGQRVWTDVTATTATVGGTLVLLVSDDASILRPVAAALEPLGAEVVACDDALRLWELLPRLRPDLLILSLDTQGVDALLLLRLIREDVRWHRLPIVVLTGDATTARAAQCREIGADDVVADTATSAQLRRRVRRQLARAVATARGVSSTMLHRIDTRSQTLDVVGHEMQRATRSGMSLCCVLLQSESEPHAAAASGAEAESPATAPWLSQQLSRARRDGETASRVSLDTVLLTWRGVTKVEADARLTRLIRSSPSPHTVSVGCVERTAVHADARELLRDTERALWRPTVDLENTRWVGDDEAAGIVATRPIDVALIEDDPALAELLELTLGVAGHCVRRWTDGADVAAALCGPTPAVAARVILLDINLPTIDGLTLLRRLGASGVLRTSRVIVMSVRASEDEMLQAFAAGAFDFVAKPLSVPVLMQRVRRALAA